MHILSSIRSIVPWSHSSSKDDASDASYEENNSGVNGRLEESVGDNSSVEEKVGERGFSKAKLLYTTLGLLFFGTAYGSGFGTSAAVHHSKTNNAAVISEQLVDPAGVSLPAI